MKNIFLYTLLIAFSISCNAQRPKTEKIDMKDYPTFYNKLVANLNKVITHKKDFYGRPLSYFINELNKNNASIKVYEPGPFDNYHIKISFIDDPYTVNEIPKNKYTEPSIDIYFVKPFNFKEATKIFNKHFSYWNPEAEEFYKDLIIDKIEFWYVNGVSDNRRISK